ncbi:MAG TPA: redoxin domain-containing protein [Polyangiaceae bacterium]|nr:redoxin domain-containing protein [Polyangiaceae bacterium]
MLKTADQAPGFELKDQFGRMIALSDYADEQHVLLVFYPLDFTPT